MELELTDTERMLRDTFRGYFTREIEPQVREAILQVKRELSDFGAKKIVAHLHRVDPDRAWPSVSAVHQTLKRAGLVERKASRRCSAHPGAPPPFTAKAPNEEWSADFKGQFRTRDRRYCYPLTIADTFSRCLLSCVSLLQPSFEQSWRVFDQAFREYGVPESIRSDNGPPFASTALRRLMPNWSASRPAAAVLRGPATAFTVAGIADCRRVWRDDRSSLGRH